MDFLTGKTKVRTIILNSLMIIALVTLAALSTLLNLTPHGRLLMCTIYSVVLVSLVLLVQGLLQLSAFKDYKCQNKYLCAQGIINIVVAILISVLGLLHLIFGANVLIDIRYYIHTLTLLYFIWNSINVINSYKEHRFNFILDIISTALTICSSIFMVIVIHANTIAVQWIIVALMLSFIVTTIVDNIITFAVRDPEYLETDKARRIRQDEIDEENLRKQKERIVLESKNAEDLLIKLKDLYENNLISIEEYNKKKIQILNKMTKGSK